MSTAVAWPADESLDPVLDPDIYVEPKDRGDALEETRQAAFVSFMHKTAKVCRVVASQNGMWMPSMKQQAKARREGLCPGEPDTAISWADTPTARIEFKSGTGDPSDNQIEALNWYHRRGHPVAICRTLDGAVAWLRSIGAPIPEIKQGAGAWPR